MEECLPAEHLRRPRSHKACASAEAATRGLRLRKSANAYAEATA
jgi:hypothetical protein